MLPELPAPNKGVRQPDLENSPKEARQGMVGCRVLLWKMNYARLQASASVWWSSLMMRGVGWQCSQFISLLDPWRWDQYVVPKRR